MSGQIQDVLQEDDAVDRTDTDGAGFVLGGDAELLVVGSNLPELAAIRENESIAEGDVVQVTGVVQAFDEAQFEDALGTTFEEGLFTDYDDRPAIRAMEVSLVPIVPTQGEQRQVTLGALDDEPTEFLGSEVTVRDAQVEQIVSPRVAALSDEVLLVTPPNASALTDGQAVEVTGRVVEVSTVQLVNSLGLENDEALFEELEIDDNDLEGFDVAIVAGSVTPRR